MSSPVTAAARERRHSSADSPASTPAAAAASRQRFYGSAAAQLGSASVPLSSPYDFEIGKLFAPALVAGLLEPVQMTAESICVGRLGVPQVRVLASPCCRLCPCYASHSPDRLSHTPTCRSWAPWAWAPCCSNLRSASLRRSS